MTRWGGEETRRGQIKKNMDRLYVEEWREQVDGMNRLEFYRSMDLAFDMKGYLRYPNKKVCVSYTRLRISDHDLRVERDRWRRRKGEAQPTPQEERLCRGCEAEKIEDEWHVFRCMAYKDL